VIDADAIAAYAAASAAAAALAAAGAKVAAATAANAATVALADDESAVGHLSRAQITTEVLRCFFTPGQVLCKRREMHIDESWPSHLVGDAVRPTSM
jgi:hypothetical protein